MLGTPAVVVARRVLDRYGAAGGSLLAGGLAYSALFAIVPGVLLTAGASGLLIGDPLVRAHVAEVIVQAMPPLRSLVGVILDEAARDAGSVSVIGAVGLVWGASRFAIAFQDGFGRILGQDRERNLVARNVLAFAVVVAMIAAFVVGTLLYGVGSFLSAAERSGALAVVGDAIGIAVTWVPPVATFVAIALVYRVVPSRPPSWRAILVPALAATVALAVLSQVFVFFAPRFIGAAALLGTLATVFAALAWLGLSFQVILLGVAWVWERDGVVRSPGQPS